MVTDKDFHNAGVMFGEWCILYHDEKQLQVLRLYYLFARVGIIVFLG